MIIQEIKESGCEFRVIKLKGTGKNALDFILRQNVESLVKEEK